MVADILWQTSLVLLNQDDEEETYEEGKEVPTWEDDESPKTSEEDLPSVKEPSLEDIKSEEELLEDEDLDL
jgi:hypothetical protein